MWILEELEGLQNSDKTAISLLEDRLSFKELWRRSEAICGYLQDYYKELPPGAAKPPLVLYGAKENDLVAAMHGALKYGIPYVPVDTLYPVERLKEIISQVQARLVVNFSDRVVEGDFRVIAPKDLEAIYGQYRDYTSDKRYWVGDKDICYMLFTSGSTGKPKGVQISKKNIMCFTNWYKEYLPVAENSIALNQVSYSFDVSVIPLYIYLARGVGLLSVDAAMLGDFKVLETALEASGLTDWVSTPALFDICTFDDKFNKQLLPKLHTFTFAGEVLTKKLVNTVKERFGPEARVINGYGPTEATVLLTACVITEAMLNSPEPLPIGSLNPALGYDIVNEQNQVVTSGSGELLVMGDSVSCGYYKNQEQTAKSFFETEGGTQGYRTGDLVYVKNGLIYYEMRRDFQIKLNGYRIEPEDISSNLNRLPMVQNSVVLPIMEQGRVSYLAAFVQLQEDAPKESSLKTAIALKKQLKELVPVYMIPKKVVVVERFPLNVNGKIDRKKLLEACK